MLQLSNASKDDIKIISDLAKIIWNDYYIPIIGQEQVNYMLENIYNYDSLLNLMEKQKHVFYLIEFELNVIGFLSISSNEERHFFLQKFYIKSDFSRKAIGSKILKILENKLNPKTTHLTVNRNNFQAINFYFKNGFKIKSLQDFDIGNGFKMLDFIMRKDFI
jgi:ribosomal protein S18 acetylase RimI-like enzyme